MKKTAISAVALAILLAGCGSKKDANEENFSAAIQQYMTKKGALCLGLTKWPVDLTEQDQRMGKAIPTSIAGQMAVLESAGLVSSSDAEIDQIGFMSGKPNGAKLKVKRYQFTEAAKKYLHEKEVDQINLDGVKKIKQDDLCYGNMALDKLGKWVGPMKLGDYQEAEIHFTYKIDGLADWANKPDFQVAFPYIARTISGAGNKEMTRAVELTSEGWEAKGLNN
jgi:hypothetical protein